MIYFNGFALKGEEKFFEEQLIKSDFCVAGFSYGAQKAFEYVYHSTQRIDRLILLSPAFFQNHKKSFIRTQLRYYKADEVSYSEQFLKNVVYPSNINLYEYYNTNKYEELESLLSYVWDKEKIVDTFHKFQFNNKVLHSIIKFSYSLSKAILIKTVNDLKIKRKSMSLFCW